MEAGTGFREPLNLGKPLHFYQFTHSHTYSARLQLLDQRSPNAVEWRRLCKCREATPAAKPAGSRLCSSEMKFFMCIP